MEDYLYVPDYTDGIIYKYDKSVIRSEIWEYFETFNEAKQSLIDYYDRLVHESKTALKKIKKLKEKDFVKI